MEPERPRRNTVKPVPGVTWRSHMGCGALIGLVAGLFYVAREVYDPSAGQLVLGALGGAVVFGLLAAVLRNRFWIR